MDVAILFEDDDVVIIDKPSGVVVNWAETVKGETLQDWMRERYRKVWGTMDVGSQKVSKEEMPISKYRGTSNVITEEDRRYFVERVGLVHRLDKETSGVMIFAKTVESFVELLAQFRRRDIEKEYLALTHGIWKVKKGEINMPIGRRHDNRQRMGVREDGRESLSLYEVKCEYQRIEFAKELKVDERGYQGFSLVSFVPKTGRTHQIRVHARAVGHPLVGDSQYAGRKRSREDRKWFPRVALQAQKISFVHPITRKRIICESKQELFVIK